MPLTKPGPKYNNLLTTENTMSKEKQPVWQSLMDEVYDEWGKHEGKSQKEVMDMFSYVHQRAIRLGNFNYQVCNGGYRQWADNGYILHIKELIEDLEAINTEISLEIAKGLKPVVEHVNFDENEKGCFGEYLITERCDYCDYGEREYDCDRCNGTGEIDYDDCTETCDECGGDGCFMDECTNCGGEGKTCAGEYYLDLCSDNRYYEINEVFMDQVEKHLINLKKELVDGANKIIEEVTLT
jgi:hypothetical protein